ncbi:MAG: mucoidy inhibitor MuiA family protein [Archangium sp.]|nr:mucoidy inhibitor MuiA family protein [Archangium sp.]
MIGFVAVMLGSLSAPDAVVVYPDRARVTRNVPVTCGAREALVFENIPPSAVVDSVRARVSAGTVDGLRVDRVTQPKRYSAEAEALSTQLEALTDSGRALDDAMAQADAQRAVAIKLLSVAEAGVSRELAAEKPDIKTWHQALETPLKVALQAAKQQTEFAAKRRALNRSIEETRRKLNEVQAAAARESLTAEVLVSCPRGTTAHVSLSYLVSNASWAPQYEARAAEGAQRVDVTTIATVTQATGEAWNGVALTLSTAVPSENATPPTMRKLVVATYEQPVVKKVLTRRDEAVAEASASSLASMSSGAGAKQMAALNQGLSVQLAVPGDARVPGDGTPVRLAVGTTSMPAHFALRAAPKLAPGVFRVATVTNSGDWPLLAGTVDVFRSTGLVGRHPLERVAQGAPFTLTFGSDETLRVKRVTLEEVGKDAGIFDSKRRFTYAYRFEVANHGAAKTEVVLEDQVPVVEVNDISVAIDPKTTAGFTVNTTSGVGAWTVPLKPQEKRTLELRFTIDVPTSYDTGGL